MKSGVFFYKSNAEISKKASLNTETQSMVTCCYNSSLKEDPICISGILFIYFFIFKKEKRKRVFNPILNFPFRSVPFSFEFLS